MSPVYIMKKFTFLLVFMLLSIQGRGQSKLEYHLKIGDVFVIKQNAEQVITQTIDTTHQIITNKIDGILEFKVIGESEDYYTLELLFEDLNLHMSSSIQGELLNVKAKEVIQGDMQSQVFNALLNNPVKLTLSRTGDIIEVKGGTNLVSKMAQASGLKDEFSLNLMKESLQKEFGSEALSNSYEQMTYIYPASKIKVGDVWDNEYNGKLKAENSWQLDGLNTKTATISGNAKVEMNIEEAMTSMFLTGKQETLVTTDLPSGFIKKMEVAGVYKGVSTVAQMGEKEIPTSIKLNITYELINKYYVQ